MPVASAQIFDDQILKRFRASVEDVYGRRVERIVLFGSRARGEAQQQSDYDIAVFLHRMGDRAREMDRLADISTDILYELGGVVHALPYRAGTYRERTPLMHEIRRDGIEL